MKIAIYLGRYPFSPRLRDDWRQGWRRVGFFKSEWSSTYVLAFLIGDIEVAFNPRMERMK